MLRFPFPLQIGTDLCQISRIHRILCGNYGPRFARRILSQQELSALRTPQSPKAHLAWLVSRSGGAPGTDRWRERQHGPLASSPGQDPRVAPNQDPISWKAAEFLAGR
jgi:holo-[acyl-carrier protein] synthase